MMMRSKDSCIKWEQLSLDLVAETSGMREYAKSDDSYWNNYAKQVIHEHKLFDDTDTKYLAYIEFKTWLIYNFKVFDEMEIETDHWQVANNKRTLDVSLKWMTNEKKLLEQYVSVSYQTNYGNYYGWSSPCKTLGEVRRSIEKGLLDLKDNKK